MNITKKSTFEDYLNNFCPSEMQTNNSSDGFERWLEDQDVNDIMEYAELYGKLKYNQGQTELINEIRQLISPN